MNCKHCDVSMKLIESNNRFLCETCQHSEPAVPVAPPSTNTSIEPSGKTSTLFCQTCDESALEIGRIYKTNVCFCNSCGGFAIDRPLLGDLVEYLRSRYEGSDSTPVPFDPQLLQASMNCLACKGSMETMLFSGPGNVVISTCETCRVSWIKKGDLDQIVRAPGQRSYESKLPGYTLLPGGLISFGLSISHHG